MNRPILLAVFCGAAWLGGCGSLHPPISSPLPAPPSERNRSPVPSILLLRELSLNPEMEREPQPAIGEWGVSGSLRVRLVLPGENVSAFTRVQANRGVWKGVYGTEGEEPAQTEPGGVLRAPRQPGVYQWTQRHTDALSSPRGGLLVVLEPASSLRQGRIGPYRIGTYPEGAGAYAPPSGYLKVTSEVADLELSRHFRVRQFLTKDQAGVWPKYVALDLRLIDKLERILQEAARAGLPASHMHVMSGYRTPQYNQRGLANGRASRSRHMYGDACDCWIDADRNGWIDDLNQDGRTDIGDVRQMLSWVETIEREHPELTGGAGIYPATPAHGPFLHIDVRGRNARW